MQIKFRMFFRLAFISFVLVLCQIIALHIDNGFMRLNESAIVAEDLKAIGVNLHVIDASQAFYEVYSNHATVLLHLSFFSLCSLVLYNISFSFERHIIKVKYYICTGKNHD